MSVKDDRSRNASDTRNGGDGRPARLDPGYVIGIDPDHEIDWPGNRVDHADRRDRLQLGYDLRAAIAAFETYHQVGRLHGARAISFADREAVDDSRRLELGETFLRRAAR